MACPHRSACPMAASWTGREAAHSRGVVGHRSSGPVQVGCDWKRLPCSRDMRRWGERAGEELECVLGRSLDRPLQLSRCDERCTLLDSVQQ